MKKIFAISISLLWLSLAAHAQSYSIDWYKIAGGSGVSSNAPYQLSGTIGQQDASGQMTGGNYSVTGGFWSLIAVQTPGAPLVTITYTNNQVIVSWPSSLTNWTLQTNGNVTTTNWVNYTGTVFNNTITNSPPKGNLFFRLTQP
jgi:hypothetical protein